MGSRFWTFFLNGIATTILIHPDGKK